MWAPLFYLALGALPLAGQDQGSYRIGVRDLLEIQVFEASDLNDKPRVSSDGLITFAPLGEVQAAGRTSPELASEIAEDLSEHAPDGKPIIARLGPVVGTYLGPGMLGFGMIRAE